MELNINIEEVVANAVTAALAPEKLEPIIQANIDKAIKSAIEGQFHWDAPFNKLLKEKVAEAMPDDIENLGRFGDLVLKTVSAYFNGAQHDFIRKAIEPKLASMLKQVPPRMKLSELVKELTEDFVQMRHGIPSGDQPTFIVERSTGACDGYWRFFADPDENKSPYSCRIQAYFTDKNICYSLKVDSEDLQKKLLIGPTYNADALMLNIYTGQIVIDPDRDDFSEVYYSGEDD